MLRKVHGTKYWLYTQACARYIYYQRMCATIIVYLFAKQMGKILSVLDLYILHAHGVFKTYLFNKLSKESYTLDLHTMYLDTRYSIVYIIWIMDSSSQG